LRLKQLKPSTRNTAVFIIAASVAILLDQVSKALVVAYTQPGESLTLIPHVLHLTYSTNTGGAFGIMRGSGQIVFLAAVVIVAVVFGSFLVMRGRGSIWAFVGLGLLIGGALGNLIDRVVRHKVVDFFDLGWWPVFNVADIAIAAGVIIVLLVFAFEFLKEDAAKKPDDGGA